MKKVKAAVVCLLLLAVASLTGCQTTPTKFESLQKGKWSAKMLVRDLVEVKSQIVNADVVAIRPHKMRLEITTPIGIHLATLAMNEKDVRIALTQQKRFLIGPSNEKGLKSIIGVAMSPQLFMDLLFDEEPGVDWTCTRGKSGFLEACENKTLKVKWKDREVARRKIEIESKKFFMQIALQGFSTKVEDRTELFELNTPSGFEVERFK